MSRRAALLARARRKAPVVVVTNNRRAKPRAPQRRGERLTVARSPPEWRCEMIVRWVLLMALADLGWPCSVLCVVCVVKE